MENGNHKQLKEDVVDKKKGEKNLMCITKICDNIPSVTKLKVK